MNKRKHPCTALFLQQGIFAQYVCYQMAIKRVSGLKSFFIWVRNYIFLKNFVTSEGAVSHNLLNYHQLSVARSKVSFYANNYFE